MEIIKKNYFQFLVKNEMLAILRIALLNLLKQIEIHFLLLN